MTANVVGIIQARAGSTRLPGKIFAPVAGRTPLLDVIARRLEPVGIEWWMATTVSPSDDVTAAWGEAVGLRVHRGSENDVLGRFLGVLSQVDAEWCVRVTADNPFSSAATVRALLGTAACADDAVCSIKSVREPRHFPLGFVPEMARAEVLRRLDATIGEADAFHRAHVTSAIPEYLTARFVDEAQPARSNWRWTIDTPADLQMARAAFELFGEQWPAIEYVDMVALLDARPDITSLNGHVPQKALKES